MSASHTQARPTARGVRSTPADPTGQPSCWGFVPFLRCPSHVGEAPTLPLCPDPRAAESHRHEPAPKELSISRGTQKVNDHVHYRTAGEGPRRPGAGSVFLLTSKGIRQAVTQKLLGPTAPGELLSWAEARQSTQMLKEATTTHGAKGPVTITGVPQTDKG